MSDNGRIQGVVEYRGDEEEEENEELAEPRPSHHRGAREPYKQMRLARYGRSPAGNVCVYLENNQRAIKALAKSDFSAMATAELCSDL